MELTEVRRAILSGYAGSLYGILKVVSKISLENDTTRLTFPFSGAGMYVVVPCPNITKDEALASGYSYVMAIGTFLYAETSSTLTGSNTSTFNSSGQLGYWGASVTFEDSTRQNIIYKANSSESVKILGGHEYYILKAKHQ